MLDTTHLARKFRLKKGQQIIELTDPNKEFSPQEVLQFHSAQYPELTTCTVSGPQNEGDAVVYEFTTTVGTKG